MPLLALTFSQGLIEFIQKSGIFIYPLFLCSVAGLTAIAFKFISLARSRTVPPALARKLEEFHEENFDSISPEIEQGKSALARLAAIGIRHQGKSPEEITRFVESAAREEILKLHAGISVLNVVITVAPLLGLLGTASGLVTIFQGLGETTDHLAIAKGIAEALNTTILGLAIAVPCVVSHSYFSRRMEQLTARMEAVLTAFVSAPSLSHSKNP